MKIVLQQKTKRAKAIVVDGKLYPTIRKAADFTGINPNSLTEAHNELQRSGRKEHEKVFRISTSFRLSLPENVL